MTTKTTLPGIPDGPTAVTIEWLEQVLRHAGIEIGLADFEAEPVGTGQVGQNIRYRLTYADGAGPGSLVAKFPSDDAASRETGVALSNYLREVRFYQELAPTLDIQTPRAWFADIDLDTQNFVLVMEDLAPAVPGDQIQGCTPEAARLAMAELARLHGPRWGDSELESIEWLGVQDEESIAKVEALWRQVFPGFEARYENRMAPDHLRIARALGEKFQSYVRGRSAPRTVTHGDYRLDNMLFGGSYPLTVVDWQSPGIGAGAADAAYFMGTALEPGARRECERELLASYHQALSGYDIGNYSAERCWEDYARASFSGLVMAVIASMIVGQTARGDEMFMAMARRSSAMAIDLDALDLL